MADFSQDTPTGDFTIDQLDYSLPEGLIAQQPPANREDARLLIVDRERQSLRDSRITEFPSLLRPGDLLVLNDTKVVPAKFLARRRSGGKVPGLFLEEIEPGTWEVLLEGSRRLKTGESLELLLVPRDPIEIELIERLPEGRWRIRVSDSRPAAAILEEYGETPLPPYVSRTMGDPSERVDRDRYQTVYARRPGAVAAPTAGLHLTEPLLGAIKDQGVELAAVTLHVGIGTFKPIGVERLADHVMHQERYEVPAATLQSIRACRARAGCIIAIGTTTVRVLETLARADRRIKGSRDQGTADGTAAPDPLDRGQSTIENLPPIRGTTNIFIRPPHTFTMVDALLTNFHLSRSTLLALVMAFAGIDLTRRAYQHAIASKYRFYSYGDAMLIV